MDEDSHLRAPWGTLLQPQSDPFTVQPRGFSRRLFLKGAAATMAIAALPRHLAPQQVAAPAARNLGPIVNAVPETSLSVEDFHPLRKGFDLHWDRIRQEYEQIHGRPYEDLTADHHKEIEKKAEEATEEENLEEFRELAAEEMDEDPENITLDDLREYVENMSDSDFKEEAFESAYDENNHKAQIERALEEMSKRGYASDELAQLTYEPDEERGPEADSSRWHAGVHFPWKVRGPAVLVRELMEELGSSATAHDDDGNELTDDLTDPEEFARVMAGSTSRHKKIISDYLQPSGPDPLDRHRSVDMDELKTKVARSLQNFLSGKTVEKVLQATQKGQSGETEAEVRNLDEAIREAGEAIKSPITVYRPLDESTVPHTKNVTGHHLHDQTYLTGTTDLERAMSLVKPGGHILAVEIPAGSTILKHEDNVVLPRHSRVRITDHATTGDGPGILKGTIDQS